MSQADLNIQNGKGSDVRSDINTQLPALASNFSGNSYPASPVDCQFHANKTASQIVIRSKDNTSWVFMGHLDKPGLKNTYAGNPNGVITGQYIGELLTDSNTGYQWVYSGTGTVWVNCFGLSDMTYRTLPINHIDIQYEYVSASQIRVLAGSRCRSDDDTTDIIYSANTTADITIDLDTGTEAINTWYYCYAIYNPTTSISKLLLSTSPTSPAMPSGYTKKRLLEVVVRNDAGSDILPFTHVKSLKAIYYNAGITLLGSGSASSWSTISCSSLIPSTSRAGLFSFLATAPSLTYCGVYVRETGTTGSGHKPVYTWAYTPYSANVYMDMCTTFPVSGSQQIDYYRTGTGTATIFCHGYIL